MPLRKDEWDSWSEAKRQFYAKLLTCYTPDGDIDVDRREKLVREQLSRQETEHAAEVIIRRSNQADYIFANCLQKNGDTLAAKSDDIEILYLLRKARDGSVDNILVGGDIDDSQEISSHLISVVRTKMPNGLSITPNSDLIAQATFVPLNEFDDFTKFLRCRLCSKEHFLIEEPDFQVAIHQEAKRLSERNPARSPADFSKEIVANLTRVSPQQPAWQIPLLNLFVARVRTHLVLYPQATYRRLYDFVKRAESTLADFKYTAKTVKLDSCFMVDFTFAFISEFFSALRLAILLVSFAGKSVKEMQSFAEGLLERPGYFGELVAKFKEKSPKMEIGAVLSKAIASVEIDENGRSVNTKGLQALGFFAAHVHGTTDAATSTVKLASSF